MQFSLAPTINGHSTLLILGTMPGEQSLRCGQYYANPRNMFWHILSSVYGETIARSYDERLDYLRSKGVALWDVLKSGEREGSLDSNILRETPNDFAALVVEYPGLRAIAFNGGKAHKLFHSLVGRRQPRSSLRHITLLALPSSSPTPGQYVLPIDQKIDLWKAILPFSTSAVAD